MGRAVRYLRDPPPQLWEKGSQKNFTEGNIKKAITLLLAVALIISAVSMFSLAATDALMYNVNTDYVAGRSGSIYPGMSAVNPMYSYSTNYRLTSNVSNSGWSFSNGYTGVTRGAYTGYTQNKRIIPMCDCRMIKYSGYALKTTPGGSTNAHSGSISTSTPMCFLGTAQDQGVTYAHLRIYINGSYYTGYTALANVQNGYGV